MAPRLCSDFPPAKAVAQFQPGAQYASGGRLWQGIPSIERAANGRLWATWYSGGKQEDNDNYVLLASSDDGGASWCEPVAVVDPDGLTRAWDPCLWFDPTGKLWWTWAQSTPMPGEVWDGRGGVWAMTTDDATGANPKWTEPRRIAHGVALNKPIFVSRGNTTEWLLPVSIWWFFEQFKELNPMRKPGVLCSTDEGATWEWRGGAMLDDRVFDEPMVIERRDGTLWMLIRTRSGIAESFSMDGGISWSQGRPSSIAAPSSRFHLRRLASGRILLVGHHGNPQQGRSHLTAMLSEDEGATWPYRLLLDERSRVSYPDATEGPAGTLHIVYDYNRFDDREILMARIDEEDILQGQCVTAGAQLRMLINKAGEHGA